MHTKACTLLCPMLALVLSACGGNTGAPGNRPANSQSNSSQPAANQPVPDTPTWTEPAARVSNEGTETRFSHTAAFWDAAAGELLVVMTRFEVDDAAARRLRETGTLSDTEPHALLLIGFDPGITELSAAAVEGHNFMLFQLTDPQPSQFANIGPESIKSITGKPAKGEKIRVHIEFRADQHKFGGTQKIHIDLRQEMTLR